MVLASEVDATAKPCAAARLKTRHRNLPLRDGTREFDVRGQFSHAETRSFGRNGAILWHFERDPIPYALETDWPVVDPVEIELVSPGKSSR